MRNLGPTDGSGGSYHVDMNGDVPGTIMQELNNLEIGTEYNISIDYAVHKLATSAGLDISIGDFFNQELLATNIGSRDGWLTADYTFTAKKTDAQLVLKGKGEYAMPECW